MNTPGAEVPTPDFHHYEWHPLAEAVHRGRFVDLSWPDGLTTTVFDLWLRENAMGVGIDPGTREGLLDPAELGSGIEVRSSELDVNGALAITWSDREEPSVFHPGWLRHVACGHHLPDQWLPRRRPWTPATLREPPTHEGPTVIESPDARRAFLNDLCALGLARLRGLRPDDGPALAALLGPVRSSNFGDFWDVKAVVDHRGDARTNTTANTSLRLGPHTDLPTRETPPGFQFLHCVENEAVGGYSTMVDGLALVDHLGRENPAVLEALTTLRWVFANRGMGIDHRWTGPMIELAGDGHPITFRAFYPLRAFPDMAPDDLPRAYEAMSLFSTLADSDAFRLAYPFRPGDLVAFDNRRILHGRDAFSVEGTRHLKGFYIDHDDVFSSARTLNRRAGEPVPGPSVDVTPTPERVT